MQIRRIVRDGDAATSKGISAEWISLEGSKRTRLHLNDLALSDHGILMNCALCAFSLLWTCLVGPLFRFTFAILSCHY